MPGPPPQPIELRLLRGNPSRRPIRPTLRVARPAEPPAAPDFLSNYAREEWLRVSPELFALRVLTELDVMALAAYCENYASWRTAVEAFNRVAAGDPVMQGLLVKGDRGLPVKNPLLGLARRAAETMLRAASEFGLTPAARSRIASVGLSAGPSKFGDLLR